MGKDDCTELRGEHTELTGAVGKIHGKLTVVLLLLATIAAGMSYSVTKTHSLDKRLIVQEYIIAAKSKSHDEYRDKFEEDMEALASVCCEK